MNQLIVDGPAAEIERVRNDQDFLDRARVPLQRDQEIVDRLAHRFTGAGAHAQGPDA